MWPGFHGRLCEFRVQGVCFMCALQGGGVRLIYVRLRRDQPG